MRLAAALTFLSGFVLSAATPFLKSELIFPLDRLHNHSSCIVQFPNGDLFACWYNGSGERKADDVKVEAARLAKGQKQWTPRVTMADTPGFPDTNPAMFVDSQKRLWLLWPVILANEWHTALMKYRISSDYERPQLLPRWEISDTMLFVPRNFTTLVRAALEPRIRALPPGSQDSKDGRYLKELYERAGDKYFSRMGWMTRVHPLELPSGRILVPLYSDGYDFSLIAMSDDRGVSWTTSEPLAGAGNVQPSLVRRRDGTLVAFMRDNGPPPKRVMVSTSKDDGITWSAVTDSDIPNPGSGLEAISLADGRWAMIYNDTENGRHSLAVSLSDDEGKTWKWTRHLELDKRAKVAGSYSYPSIIQAADGTLHATYSYSQNDAPKGQSIKHAHFNTDWIVAGER